MKQQIIVNLELKEDNETYGIKLDFNPKLPNYDEIAKLSKSEQLLKNVIMHLADEIITKFKENK